MTKIYLASSNFKPFHADWIKRAKTALTDNPTVDIVHNPWDHQYKNVSFDDTTGLFGSLEWQLKPTKMIKTPWVVLISVFI